MAGNDIKQRIVLEGEKEYSNALKEAQRNLKVLRSELKAETAELGKNATEQQKNETRLKNLQKQIKEQEKVVKTYEKALEEVREKYGDNEEAVAKWEIKLNDARTALANMKNSLNDVGQGMKAVQDSANLGIIATNSLADSLSKIGDVGGTISDSIESSFTSLLGTVKESISIIWESVVDLAAKSNNLTDMAGFWNTSATNIQKWGKAASAASGTLSDMNDLVTKIVAKSSSDTKTGGILAGVSPENYEDQWEFAMAVMDSLSQLPEGKERIAAATDIFGKNYTKALDFVNDWDKIKAALNDNDVEQGGYGLTEDQIQKMSDLYDQVNRLRESWQSLKDMATVELFGDLAINITGNIQNVLDAFRDYFNAENEDEKAQALAKVKENILEAFKNVRTAIQEGIELLSSLAEELQNSDDSLAQALGKALEGLVSALEWLTDEGNWDTIKAGIAGLIGLWAAGNIADAIANITAFAANLQVISGFRGGGLVANVSSGIGDIGTSIGAALSGSLGGTLVTSLTTALAGGIMIAGFLAGAVAVMDRLFKGESPEAAATREVLEETKEVAEQMVEGGAEVSGPAKQAVAKDMITAFFGGKTHFIEDYNKEAAEQAAQAVVEAAETVAEQMPQTELSGVGPMSPVKRARFDATPEQQEAANAFWDVWRNYDSTDDEINNAWVALEKAFEGNEGVFDNLSTWLDRMIRDYDIERGKTDFNPELWDDIPSTWWKNPAGENGLTQGDIQGFRTLPGQMSAAVARGVSGIKVQLDGQTVGSLVAPYVSEQIAQSIYG